MPPSLPFQRPGTASTKQLRCCAVHLGSFSSAASSQPADASLERAVVIHFHSRSLFRAVLSCHSGGSASFHPQVPIEGCLLSPSDPGTPPPDAPCAPEKAGSRGAAVDGAREAGHEGKGCAPLSAALPARRLRRRQPSAGPRPPPAAAAPLIGRRGNPSGPLSAI